jgi:hypothetical protein
LVPFLERKGWPGRAKFASNRCGNSRGRLLALPPNTESEIGLLIRDERKVEMEIDKEVVAELVKLMQKIVGERDIENVY